MTPDRLDWLLMEWGKAFVSQAVTAFDKRSMECQALQHNLTLVVTTLDKLSSFLIALQQAFISTCVSQVVTTSDQHSW